MATTARCGGKDGLSYLSRIAGIAVLVWVNGAACDRTPAPARADSPSVRPAAATDASLPTPSPTIPAPTPAATATRPVTPRQIVDIIANKTAYPVPLADASTRFASIATLTRETPTPDEIWMAGSGPAVRRLEVGYSRDATGKWIFSYAMVLLAPSPPEDVTALHGQVVSALRKKLGKPKFTKKGEDPLPQMGWKLGGPIELWIGEETSTIPGANGPDRHIRIGVSAPNGEAD